MAKVLVSFDEGTLHRIDRIAKARGLTRSAYLSSLAEEDARRSAPGRERTVRAALRELDRQLAGAPAAESTDAVRAARDAG